MKLLAIIIAFGLYHYVDKPALMKNFNWVDELRLKVHDWNKVQSWQWLILISVPLFLCWLLFYVVFGVRTHGMAYLLLNVALLYCCLGPNTIAAEIDDQSLRKRLKLHEDATSSDMVYAITDAALHRWFGVFFWYVVLGIYGALAYRLICYVAKQSNANHFEKHALKVMNYPVTLLMTLSLALASDFEKVWQQAKQYFSLETIQTMNSLFLYHSMDYAVEHCEIETKDEQASQIIERTTYTVLKRMLVVWLVFVALLVLFTKG